MATVSTTINEADGWVLVESTGVDALIQCQSGGSMKVSFAAAAPAVDTPNYHILQGREYIRRIGTDNVYVATDYDGVIVTVTT